MAQDISFDIIARDKATSTFNKVARSSDGAGAHLRKFGQIAAVALGGVAVAAGGLGVKLAQMAIEDEASSKKLARALQNNAKATKGQIAATEKWIAAQGKAYGVSDEKLRPALVRLVSATHNVGKAQKLASLAINVSAGTGKSLEAVTMALTKAQNGNVGALGRLGINVKKTTGNTVGLKSAQIAAHSAQLSYTNAVKAHGAQSAQAKIAAEKLTLAQQKVGAAQKATTTTSKSLHDVMKDLSSTFGGQAATAADTAAGRFARVKLAFSETAEAIGYKLLPIASRLADWLLNKGIPAFGRFADKVKVVAGKISDAFKKINLGDLASKAATIAGDISTAFGKIKLGGFAKKVKTALDKVNISNLGTKLSEQAKSWAAPVINGFKLGLDTGDWSGLGKALGNGVVKALKGAGRVAGKIVNALTAMFKKVDWVGLGIKIGTIALPLLLGLATGLINGVSDPGLWKGIWAHLPEILWAALAIALAPSKVIGPIAKILERIPFVGRFLAAALKWVNKLGGPVRKFAVDLFKTFGRAFTHGADLPAGRIVSRVLGALRGLPEALGRFYIKLGTRIGVWALDAFEWMGRSAGKATGKLLRLIVKIPVRIIKSLGNLDSLLVNAGRTLIDGLIHGITSKLSAVGKAMGKVASKVKGFLPGSPVKEGPLRSWNNGGAGKRLVGLLAHGLSFTNPVDSAMSSLSSKIALGAPAVAVADTHSSASGSREVRRPTHSQGAQFSGITVYAQDVNDFLRQMQTRARHSGLDGRRR